MNFTKMSAGGNDYVYVETFSQTVTKLNRLSQRVSDRHFGIGSDGLIVLCPSERADFGMRVFNPDGSEAEMCGNALMSSSMLFYEKGFTTNNFITVETAGGLKKVRLTVTDGHVSEITANIGRPLLFHSDVPVTLFGKDGRCVGERLVLADREFAVTAMSFGNPHCALLCDDAETFDLEHYGRAAENNAVFPNRVNATFYCVRNRGELFSRTWERGCGETLSCGTGACCCAAAAALSGAVGRSVTVHQLGGDIKVRWDENDDMQISGAAHIVFDGIIAEEP